MKRALIIIFSIALGISGIFSHELPDIIGAVPYPNAGFAIDGSVSDKFGEPIIGASVRCKENPEIYAVTDADGKFRISNIPDSCVTIHITCVGFLPHTLKVTSQKSAYPIVLDANSSELDEVVVVGYATQKKVNLTGAVSSISPGALENRPVTNVTNALAGLAAGLTVTNSGGNTPGYESQSIMVRGLGTLNNAAPTCCR